MSSDSGLLYRHIACNTINVYNHARHDSNNIIPLQKLLAVDDSVSAMINFFNNTESSTAEFLNVV